MKTRFALVILIAVLPLIGVNISVVRASLTPHLPVHNIDTGLDYSTIQEAIYAPATSDGHRLQVDAGTYIGCVRVNKSLSIIGEGRENTIVRGSRYANLLGSVFYVKANNVTISGFTIRDGMFGVQIRANYTRVVNCTILNNVDGIVSIYSFGGNTVTGNIIRDNRIYGISMYTSSDVISENTITDNKIGIELTGMFPPPVGRTSGCIVVRNNITNNRLSGLDLSASENNTIYHNNFLNNTVHASSPNTVNRWDYGYPYGGNYWDDYAGSDGDQDGIGDEPYLIEENNQDNYPLMGIVSSFNIPSQSQTYSVTIMSNSTIENFSFNADGSVCFNVGGTEDTVGFCAVCIPKVLLNTPYTICIGNHSPTMMKELTSTNETHTFLYFTYEHTADDVTIIPELSPIAFMPIIILSVAITLFMRRRRIGTVNKVLLNRTSNSRLL